MAHKLRLGIVGCGDIARYIAIFAHLSPEFTLTACCDRSLASAQGFAKRYRIPQAYGEFAHMLDREALDAVYLSVPHDLHAPMLKATIKRGLPTLVEKPVTRTLAEGIEISSLAAQAQVKIGVNYQYRYDKACYALARAVQANALGDIYTMRCNLAWHRDLAYFTQSSWHTTIARAGGGTLITQASHLLDIAIWAMQQAPVAATALVAKRKFKDVDIEDTAHGTLEMANGTLIQIHSTMAAHTDTPLAIEVYGEDGTAIYSNKPRPHLRNYGVTITPQSPGPWGLHALHRSLRAFGQWVLHDVPYLTPAQEALPVLAAIDGLYRAASKQQRVDIEALRQS